MRPFLACIQCLPDGKITTAIRFFRTSGGPCRGLSKIAIPVTYNLYWGHEKRRLDACARTLPSSRKTNGRRTATGIQLFGGVLTLIPEDFSCKSFESGILRIKS